VEQEDDDDEEEEEEEDEEEASAQKTEEHGETIVVQSDEPELQGHKRRVSFTLTKKEEHHTAYPKEHIPPKSPGI